VGETPGKETASWCAKETGRGRRERDAQHPLSALCFNVRHASV